jgi:hypothetical protein
VARVKLGRLCAFCGFADTFTLELAYHRFGLRLFGHFYGFVYDTTWYDGSTSVQFVISPVWACGLLLEPPPKKTEEPPHS